MLWRCRRAARGTETLAHRSGLRSPSPSASFPVLRHCIGSGCGRAERGVRPRGMVYPERDGAANVEAVISVVLDEFHVRPPLTYRLAQGHGLVDEGHRRGNSPFGAPVVDLDGARPDHDTPATPTAQAMPTLVPVFIKQPSYSALRFWRSSGAPTEHPATDIETTFRLRPVRPLVRASRYFPSRDVP